MDQLFTFIVVLIWPLIGLLFGWWGSFIFLDESKIMSCALIGLIAGAGYAVTLWRGTCHRLFTIGWLPLLGILLFYAAGMFGFFMGVPVFHVFLSIPAGLYWGRRVCSRQLTAVEIKKQQRWLVWVVGGTVALVGASSGLIAWSDPYTLANLRGMLQLQLTPLFLLLTIWIGGFLLVGLTMWLTRWMFILGQKSVRKETV